MTLIIAGYKQKQFLWGKPQDYIPDRKSGIFMVADSLISTQTPGGRRALLSEFRKIVEIPIQIWEPHFVGEHFSDYIKVFTTYKCLVAFAGSTLTAQHIINNISGHLAKLRIDFENIEEFKCIVRMICEKNNLVKNGISSVYDDDIFIPERDYQNLVSAEFVSDVVEHSINKALESKMKHVIDIEALTAMRTEILLGLTCPVSRIDHLYKYHFLYREIPGEGVETYCQKELIQADEVGVLGMVNTYSTEALEIARNSFRTGTTFQEDITKFVVESVRNDNTNEIGLPVAVKTIEGNSVKQEFIK
ncbi:hypothetical protein [Rheinheimera sp.]|uniref:hypothetical protein n=1 Tax=Rheinheimera sp. TaxID=1869214 RepID=UPI002FDC8F3E